MTQGFRGSANGLPSVTARGELFPTIRLRTQSLLVTGAIRFDLVKRPWWCLWIRAVSPQLGRSSSMILGGHASRTVLVRSYIRRLRFHLRRLSPALLYFTHQEENGAGWTAIGWLFAVATREGGAARFCNHWTTHVWNFCYSCGWLRLPRPTARAVLLNLGWFGSDLRSFGLRYHWNTDDFNVVIVHVPI